MSGEQSEIPKDIGIYLNEIAERLWSGHAAVMVGSGFSKNAKSSVPSAKGFPDWNQLGNIFYEKLYGCPPSEKDHYLNVLKLADEVQAAFGRPALDQLIRSEIPDKIYEPSSLHTKLLELPWRDIFTTNYDTLLERACVNVTSQRFDIVTNKEDLIYSEQPRIIKLHGSLPSERPFIITEEDYRRYPVEFAPFVNTIQQSLLENTLCLIGFSSDDPNFLKWIGWIRDNLGKGNSPKIYLIDIFNISNAKKKLLEQCNVVLVDLSLLPGVEGDYAKGLDAFFEYLLSKKKDNSQLRWPPESPSLNREKNNVSQIKNIVKEWKQQRRIYPNWVIVPQENRDRLWLYTESWIQTQLFQSLDVPLSIDFLYELNWRLEKCLCPIFGCFIAKYEAIIGQFNPFPELVKIESAVYIKNKSEAESYISWEDIQTKWLELNIAVMRFYREEGCLDRWSIMEERMQKLLPILPPELTAKLHYERCLQALFSLDIPRIEALLDEWPVNENLPFWEAKRAGLMAEFGDVAEAEKILEKSLAFIRAQLNLSPVTNDYTLVSQESYVMQLLQYVKSALRFRQRKFDESKEFQECFQERWHSLKQFKCDPWNEFKLFELYLEHEPENKLTVHKTHGFDLDKIIIHHYFESYDKEALTAYNFLCYCEEVGIPFRICRVTRGKKVARGALKRISKHSPYWALATLLRIGDTNIVDTIFNRESIFKTHSSEIDRLVDGYLNALERAKYQIENGDRFDKQNFATQLADIIPEILSRLCVKCSTDARNKLLNFLSHIYMSEHKINYEGCGIANLVERLIHSWSSYELYQKIPELLKIPLLDVTDEVIAHKYPEPFYYITSLDRRKSESFEPIQIEDDDIDKLLEKANSTNREERKRAVARVGCLFKLGLLSKEQEKLFGNVLWSQVDEQTELPINTNYYNFVFLSLPHPESVNPTELLKRYIKSDSFLIEKDKEGKGITITGGDISICREIIGATKGPFSEVGIEWSEQEAIKIFFRLVEWWDADKSYIERKNGILPLDSIRDEFKKRFYNLVEMLTYVVLPKLTPKTDQLVKNQLCRLIKELDIHDVPCLSAMATSITIFLEKKEKVYNLIESSIISLDEENIIDAYRGVYQILALHKQGKLIEIRDDIWDSIAQVIKWRCMPALIYAINVANNILEDMPELMPEIVLGDILVGLNYLLAETNLDHKSSPIEPSLRLLCREKAASLAYRLYNYYSHKNLIIPEVVMKWKEVCSSSEEFAEIRNQWDANKVLSTIPMKWT